MEKNPILVAFKRKLQEYFDFFRLEKNKNGKKKKLGGTLILSLF